MLWLIEFRMLFVSKVLTETFKNKWIFQYLIQALVPTYIMSFSFIVFSGFGTQLFHGSSKNSG